MIDEGAAGSKQDSSAPGTAVARMNIRFAACAAADRPAICQSGARQERDRRAARATLAAAIAARPARDTALVAKHAGRGEVHAQAAIAARRAAHFAQTAENNPLVEDFSAAKAGRSDDGGSTGGRGIDFARRCNGKGRAVIATAKGDGAGNEGGDRAAMHGGGTPGCKMVEVIRNEYQTPRPVGKIISRGVSALLNEQSNVQ